MEQPVPKLTAGEWKQIAAVLPVGRAMRQRHDDRDVVSALFYAEAMYCSLEDVPHQYGIGFKTLRTRQARWKLDGTWPRVLDRGAAAIARMRRDIGQDDLMQQLAEACGWDRL
jgi:transposase